MHTRDPAYKPAGNDQIREGNTPVNSIPMTYYPNQVIYMQEKAESVQVSTGCHSGANTAQ